MQVDTVFALIQNMQEEDKDAFEQRLIFEKKAQLVQLLNAFRNLDSPDKEELFSKFDQEYLNNYKETKTLHPNFSNQLSRFNKLLNDFIRIPYEDKFSHTRIDAAKATVLALHSLNIPTLRDEKLKEVVEEALKYEYYPQLIELLRLKIKFSLRSNQSNSESTIYEAFEQIEEAEHCFIQEIAVSKWKYKLLLKDRNGEMPGDSLDRFLGNAKSEMEKFDQENIQSFEAKSQYFQGKSLYYRLSNQLDLSADYSKKTYLHWISNEQFREDRPDSFLALTANYLLGLLSEKDSNGLKAALNEYEALFKSNTASANSEFIANYYLFLFYYFFLTKNLEAIFEKADSIMEELAKHKNGIVSSRQITIPYNIGVAYFYDRQFPKSYFYFGVVENNLKPGDILQGLMVSTYLLKAIMLLDDFLEGKLREKRNDDLNNLIKRQLRENLKNWKLNSELTKELISLIRGVYGAQVSKGHLLLPRLKKLEQFCRDNYKKYPGYCLEEIGVWASSRVHGSSMRDEYLKWW